MSTIINIEFNHATFPIKMSHPDFNARVFYDRLNQNTSHLLNGVLVPYVIENMDTVGVSSLTQIHPMTYHELGQIGDALYTTLLDYQEDYDLPVNEVGEASELIHDHFDKFKYIDDRNNILSPIYNFAEIVLPLSRNRYLVYRVKPRKRKITGFISKLLDNYKHKVSSHEEGTVKVFTILEKDHISFLQGFGFQYSKLFYTYETDVHPDDLYSEYLIG